MAQRSPIVPITGEDNQVAVPADQAGTPPVVLVDPVEPSNSAEKAKAAAQAGMNSAVDSLHAAQRRVASATRTAVTRFREFADERPLHLLAIVAGVAFAAGVGLRIWRSSRYE